MNKHELGENGNKREIEKEEEEIGLREVNTQREEFF